MTHSTAYQIEIILRGIEKVPTTLAAIIEQYPHDQEGLFQLARGAVENNPEVFGSAVAYEPYVFSPESLYFCPYAYREGQDIKQTFLGGDDYHYFHWDWYQIPKELNRPIWTEPYYDEGGGNVIMPTFSVPFYLDTDGERTFQGIVTADISLMWLEKIISQVKIYETGYAFLISQNGVFVTHPNNQLIMRESVFSVAESQKDFRLRQIGKEMIGGAEGFVLLEDFTSGEKSWMYYTSLPSTGWAVGVVISQDELFAPLSELSTRIILMVVAGLAVLGIVITSLSRSITKPVRMLDKSTSVLAKGDFSVTVAETGPKEIAHLAHSFNQLGQRLTEYIEKRDFVRDTFGRYVTKEVVNKLLESDEALELGGETREVSIIMSDLRGFTALTAEMEPSQIITFLNQYLEKMIEILLEHQAVIDEIIGDGILAFLGAPQPMEDHATQAVTCALRMQAAMEQINLLNRAEGLPYLEMGIAVNTGTVVVGNIGSEKRTKYGLVGAQVNLTGRIESFTVGGQLLISETTFQRVKELVEVKDTIQLEMKGVPGLIHLYDIRGIRGPTRIRLKERNETLLPLPKGVPVNVYRIQNKIVTLIAEAATLTHLSETAATIRFSGTLA